MDAIPDDLSKMAGAVTDAAEAECRAQRYVYGFGTGNAKAVLDRHIAAALMAERDASREKVAQFMLRNSFATGHGDTIDDLLGELEAWFP